MNRNKVYAKSKENQMIIKALNMYGRVPETWELLEEIERLNNIIIELEKSFTERGFTNIEQMATMFDWYKEEIERLNNIIGEAIEYIELWHYRNDFRVNSFTKGVKEELLEILKGSDKE